MDSNLWVIIANFTNFEQNFGGLKAFFKNGIRTDFSESLKAVCSG